ncbi:TPA: hypothetical protein EYP37_07445 [Candidatus Poribacteria bacterium]|nr:hypothetical protein [Candidatus Poribacteria bacterium]
MIEGYISNSGAPVIKIKVKGRRDEIIVEGILDTGFDGYLCLPIPIAVSLGLELIKVVRTELADGTILEDELVFAGEAEWDGSMAGIDILLTRADDVLLGTGFLRGYQVRLDYGDNTVRIERVGG